MNKYINGVSKILGLDFIKKLVEDFEQRIGMKISSESRLNEITSSLCVLYLANEKKQWYSTKENKLESLLDMPQRRFQTILDFQTEHFGGSRCKNAFPHEKSAIEYRVWLALMDIAVSRRLLTNKDNTKIITNNTDMKNTTKNKTNKDTDSQPRFNRGDVVELIVKNGRKVTGNICSVHIDENINGDISYSYRYRTSQDGRASDVISESALLEGIKELEKKKAEAARKANTKPREIRQLFAVGKKYGIYTVLQCVTIYRQGRKKDGTVVYSKSVTGQKYELKPDNANETIWVSQSEMLGSLKLSPDMVGYQQELNFATSSPVIAPTDSELIKTVLSSPQLVAAIAELLKQSNAIQPQTAAVA